MKLKNKFLIFHTVLVVGTILVAQRMMENAFGETVGWVVFATFWCGIIWGSILAWAFEDHRELWE